MVNEISSRVPKKLGTYQKWAHNKMSVFTLNLGNWACWLKNQNFHWIWQELDVLSCCTTFKSLQCMRLVSGWQVTSSFKSSFLNVKIVLHNVSPDRYAYLSMIILNIFIYAVFFTNKHFWENFLPHASLSFLFYLIYGYCRVPYNTLQ